MKQATTDELLERIASLEEQLDAALAHVASLKRDHTHERCYDLHDAILERDKLQAELEKQKKATIHNKKWAEENEAECDQLRAEVADWKSRAETLANQADNAASDCAVLRDRNNNLRAELEEQKRATRFNKNMAEEFEAELEALKISACNKSVTDCGVAESGAPKEPPKECEHEWTEPLVFTDGDCLCPKCGLCKAPLKSPPATPDPKGVEPDPAFEAEMAAIKAMAGKPKVCPPHRWGRDGERCMECGDKDWMT